MVADQGGSRPLPVPGFAGRLLAPDETGSWVGVAPDSSWWPPVRQETHQGRTLNHAARGVLIGMKLVVSYLSAMNTSLDERTRLQMQLSSGLLHSGRQWQRLADSALGSYGISTACTMPLLMIGRSGGGIRQVTLAQQLGLEGPSLVRLLDKLSASGLVRRECDASDRRANLLWLTDEGQALVSELEQQLIGLREEVFGELSMDELRAVLKVWQLLSAAVDRIT